jgi:hypothetical protein
VRAAAAAAAVSLLLLLYPLLLLLLLLLLFSPAVSQIVSLMLWSPTSIRLIAKSTPGHSTHQGAAHLCSGQGSTTHVKPYQANALLRLQRTSGWGLVHSKRVPCCTASGRHSAGSLTDCRWQLRLKLVSNEPETASTASSSTSSTQQAAERRSKCQFG